MTLYAAKAIGFALAYWAKEQGYCYRQLMKFKMVEIIALLACVELLTILQIIINVMG